MIINYLLWIITGLVVGYAVFYFDLNKKKDLEVHLFVSLIITFLGALLVQTVIWQDPPGDINFVAIVVGAICGYIGMTYIDYFFHL